MKKFTEPTFDVFLSYNSADRPSAIRIKEALESRGIKVWLDRDEIRPGDLFVGALEAGLEVSRAVVLLISPEAVESGWVREEYSRALSLTQRKTQPLRLIPVIIRETDLPGFLLNRHGVDFRIEADFEISVSQLIYGITGRKETMLPSATTDAQSLTPPDFERYIGGETAYRVNALVREYAKLFVGREQEMQQLDDFVRQQTSVLMIVTARAGFGKSALIANWIVHQAQAYFIAYHFFNHLYKEVTCPVVRGLRNLLRQLHVYYRVDDRRLPNDESSLRDAINGIVTERGAENGPLILILDGLDEAEHPFAPPLPVPLPKDIWVIATARAETGEMPEYLKGWSDQATLLRIDRLPNFAIVKWVREVGDGILSEFAKNRDFIGQLEEKTEGFPLYLHFLLQEVAEAVMQSKDVSSVLNGTPRGFGTYVRRQFGMLAHIKDVRGEPKIQDLFALLAVAKGPLSAEEVQDLTGLNSWDLNDLPWQVTRWFTTFEQLDKSTYTFANTLLADEFQHALGREADRMLDKLVDYCADWSLHKKSYPLRHYAEHLRDLKLWKRLFQLARDDAFQRAQSALNSDESDLQLRTIRSALVGAIDSDSAPEMAEFVLAHVRLAARSSAKESPFDAFTEGKTVKALRLAESYNDPVPVLWHLLLIWLLLRAGKQEEARNIVRGLTHVKRPKLTHWMADVAATLLSLLTDLPPDNLLTAASRLLTSYHLRIFILFLTKRGTKKTLLLATEVIPLINHGRERDKALLLVATSLAIEGDWEGAMHQVGMMQDIWFRTWALSDLCFVALQQKDIVRAEQIVWELEVVRDDLQRDDGARLDTNWQMAKALANLAVYYSYEQPQRTQTLLEDITVIAEKTYRNTFKSRVLVELAKAYAFLEQPSFAESSFDEALQVAAKITLPREKARALGYIGRGYAKTDNREKALRIFDAAKLVAQNIPEQAARAEVFEELVKDYMYEGEFEAALGTASLIDNSALATKAVAEITKLLVIKGQTESACAMAQNKREWAAAWLLSEIGIALLDKGRGDDAIEMWVRSFSEMRIVHGENPSLPVIQTLADLARAQLDSGDEKFAGYFLERAINRAHQTLDPKKRVWHAIDIARTVGNKVGPESLGSLLDGAYAEITNTMTPETRVWLLSQTAATAYVKGQIVFAEKLFREAELVANNINDTKEQVQALCRIGEALGWAERADEARVFLDKARDRASTIGLRGIRGTLLSHVALAYAKSELMSEARTMLSNKDIRIRQNGRKAAALIYSSEGNTAEAIQESLWIANTKGQAQALRYIAVYLAKHGSTKDALLIADILVSTRDTEFHPVEIPRITRAIVEAGDLDSFKSLLITNAYRVGSAYRIVGLIARLYPQHAGEIGQRFIEVLDPGSSIPQLEFSYEVSPSAVP